MKTNFAAKNNISNIAKIIKFFPGLIAAGLIIGCNGGSSSGGSSDMPPNIINNIPTEYQNLPRINVTNDTSKIAYAGEQGYVGAITDSSLKSSLSSMAVSLSDSTGRRYCTGTPLYVNPNTKDAFILTAAHCVVGNPKKANTPVSATDNIVTFSLGRNYINQNINASTSSGTTGVIQAVYLVQDYCKNPPFAKDSTTNTYYCHTLEEQNGDIAIIKASVTTPLSINPQVKLPTINLSIVPGTLMLSLGYGKTETNDYNTKLNYINYEYFGTNSYQGVNAEKVLLNGYNPVTPNSYYSIICGGDSGGGDFYWDGSSWQLVGVHSYGSNICGQANSTYENAFDASADVRPFTTQISNIIYGDTTQDACDPNVAASNGFICLTKPQP